MTAMAPDSYVSLLTTQQQPEDKSVCQLLAKLDEGMQTVANLRSILTLKTAELNELLAQLELTSQAILNVEQSTDQIENMLKGLGLTEDGGGNQMLLLDAEASLDKAIKSANNIYSDASRQLPRPTHARTNRYRPDTKSLVRQLNQLLRDLEIDADSFFATIKDMDDVHALQKAKVDLDLAKTVALAAKSNLKRRSILLKNTTRHNPAELVTMATKIRESVRLWRSYAQDAPMRVDGKDILEILDAQDVLMIAKNRESPPPPPPLLVRRRKSIADLHATSPRSPTTHSRISSLHAGLPTTTDPLGTSSLPTSPMTPTTPTTRWAGYPPPPLGFKSHPATMVRSPVIKTTLAARATKPPSAIQKMTPQSNKPANIPPTQQQQQGSFTPAPLKKPTTSTSKQPGSRGPGSTLRLRSMLAKRSHLPRDITA